MGSPLVSLITPTLNRHKFLPLAAKFVLAQSVADFEWLVLDDSPSPSEFMRSLSDSRIVYEHTAEKQTTGSKRNTLIDRAKGNVIALWDDDDYYGPNYLATMLSAMEEEEADIVKFYGFFLYHTLFKTFGFWDLQIKLGPHWGWAAPSPRMVMLTEQNNERFKDNHLGYGFSYVFKKKVWAKGRFPDITGIDDTVFMREAVRNFRLKGLYDVRRDCLHVLHGANVSSCFPQYLIPNFLVSDLFPGAGELLAIG
jgi:glycosyltransferase involved in cell wall biosynthesis